MTLQKHLKREFKVIRRYMFSRYISSFHRPRRPLGKVEVYLYSILDLLIRMGWGVSVTPRQHITPGKNPVPIVQEDGWGSRPVWYGAENFGPPGFNPRTVQPVGSRYTDYATRPTTCSTCFFNFYSCCFREIWHVWFGLNVKQRLRSVRFDIKFVLLILWHLTVMQRDAQNA